MQARNFLLFIALTILVLFGWMELERRIWPKKPVPELTAEEKKLAEEKKQKEKEEKEKAPPKAEKDPPKPVVAEDDGWGGVHRAILRAAARRTTAPEELVTLGTDDPSSKFQLEVVFDPRGAGVRKVLLNRFKAGDDLGRPTKPPKLLELVPEKENDRHGSFHLLHYRDPSDDAPKETLGLEQWKASKKVEDTTKDGRKRESVSFRTEVGGVEITKTFSLIESDYHLGLEVKMKRTDDGEKPLKFRYQLVGAHGLHVEGKWYTSTFRNALIGRVDKTNTIERDIQDLRQISIWGGGKAINKENNKVLRYAAVVVQYFASAIVVDDEQETQDFLIRARPTLEVFVLKGRVKSISERGTSFVLETDDHKEETIYLPDEGPTVTKGDRFAVVATTDGRMRTVALELADEAKTHPLWRDDITVRVTTEPLEFRKAGSEVVHKYLLYNGPVKPSLLGMPGHDTVPPEVIERYVDKLKLNTFTDYQSPGFFGSFSSTIYWTDIIIKCTNLMHWILSQINRVIPNYGLCIICLTILVRGLMFPVSRKQAMMSMKMQELAPEMKKLQEKFKGDRQAIGVATMELYRKHGVNPFGTCWFILLQMPIFMGLYFALQESTYFRLAGAWPTWITNLAAPDMLYEWGEGIPWLSRPQDYGGFLYLGPYLNLMPIIAVALMIMQQKMMTPPPQDEQQEMQQKVMKYMMIFFGLLFYKVAAGLCIYFIASSLWGFAERKLLPKKKLNVGKVSADAALEDMLTPSASGQQSTAVTASASVAGVTSGRGRKQGRVKKRPDGETPSPSDENGSGSMWSRFRKRVSSWWADMQKKADKK